MSYWEERRAAYESRLETLAAVAAALGGALCSCLEHEAAHGEARDAHVPSHYHIHLPGELFVVEVGSTWRDPSRCCARLVIPRYRQDAATCRGSRGPAPTFSMERPAAGIAADIRRRCIEPERRDAVATQRQLIERERAAAVRSAFLEDLARQLGVPALRHCRGHHDTWTAPGFSTRDYDIGCALSGQPLRCEISLPLHAFALIAPIIAAANPPALTE